MALKILFIGGTGTISSACAKESLSRGCELTLLVRGQRDSRIPTGAKVIHGDIRKNPSDVKNKLKDLQWDIVVDWVAFNESDIDQDFEIFNGRTKKYVFISSTSVYSKPLPSRPITESDSIGETGWSYADAKARAEKRLNELILEENFPAMIVRPGAVYSEFVLSAAIAGLGFGLIERMKLNQPILIPDQGETRWSMLFNQDFANAFCPLIESHRTIGETFHIASEEKHTWNDIHHIIKEVFGIKNINMVHIPTSFIQKLEPELGASIACDKAHEYDFDLKKLKGVVPNFKSEFSLRRGLEQCFHFYTNRPDQVFYNQLSQEKVDRIIGSWLATSDKVELPI